MLPPLPFFFVFWISYLLILPLAHFLFLLLKFIALEFANSNQTWVCNNRMVLYHGERTEITSMSLLCPLCAGLMGQILFQFYLKQLCVGMHVCTWAYLGYVYRVVGDARVSGAGVTDSCKPPFMDVGDQTWVLWCSIKRSYPLSHFSSPGIKCFLSTQEHTVSGLCFN